MTFQDLIVTPVWLVLLILLAYLIRPLVTSPETKTYLVPGLFAKFLGAIALGFIYQFYYDGGDTFSYHTNGSIWIWKAFMDSPLTGIDLLFQTAGDYNGQTFNYSSHIWFFRDPKSMMVVKIASVFDLFTYGTYSATALFFAIFSFSGSWALFTVLQKLYPSKTRLLAIAILFIPSVVFWGSGILKDSITLGALCWMSYALFRLTIFKKFTLANLLLLGSMAWIIYTIKIYILLCFMASTALFLYLQYIGEIKNRLLKLLAIPALLLIFSGGGYYAINKIAEEDSRYALDKIAETAMITAYDIRYGWGARHGDNSGYTLGELDGTFASLLRLAPEGVVVTLFRPWPWEIKNPLMLMASLESALFLIITIGVVIQFFRKNRYTNNNQPLIWFCLSFTLLFAFAVGVSTFNFGTLMRYKIPVFPFFASLLVIINSKYGTKS